MSFGRTVKVFLVDGKSTGLRVVEISNWTGLIFAFYRSNLNELENRSELRRQGIYFLIGYDDNSLYNFKMYIGEAENIIIRIKQHLKKDFWHQGIIFTSKDENLTKGHVKYLEARVINILNESGQIKLDNNNSPKIPSLPESDQASMEEYLSNLFLIMGTLGFPQINQKHEIPHQDDLNDNDNDSRSLFNTTFIVKSKTIRAKMRVIENNYVVLKGSEVAPPKISLTGKLKELRDNLLERGIIETIDDKCFMNENYPFSSSSYASAFVLGRSSNGRSDWTDENGKLFALYEEEILSE